MKRVGAVEGAEEEMKDEWVVGKLGGWVGGCARNGRQSAVVVDDGRKCLLAMTCKGITRVPLITMTYKVLPAMTCTASHTSFQGDSNQDIFGPIS
jgi:hypothetical protein